MKIIQINTLFGAGGAAIIVEQLHKKYISSGISSWVMVGHKARNYERVIEFPYFSDKKLFTRLTKNISTKLGIEDFSFWKGKEVERFFPEKPDIIHCHNLHGNYFNLRSLKYLSGNYPVFLTLHDAWTLGGHCAHSFECQRWTSGCGQCPDISIYQSISRDMSAFNWRLKRNIYKKCSFFLVTPSQWLMEKVKKSMLLPAIKKARVINNGIDTEIFQMGDMLEARRILDIPSADKIVIFASNGVKSSIWKDYQMMRKAVEITAKKMPGTNIQFLALGEESEPEKIGDAVVKFVPPQEQERLALYYRAADLYMHAAKAETFPNVIIESLACGTPVVATAIGGIPEQIKSLKSPPGVDCKNFDNRSATGILVPGSDADAMAKEIFFLLSHPDVLAALGINAAKDAKTRFSLGRQVSEYMGFYEECLAN